jgi:hypothetical protein
MKTANLVLMGNLLGCLQCFYHFHIIFIQGVDSGIRSGERKMKVLNYAESGFTIPNAMDGLDFSQRWLT